MLSGIFCACGIRFTVFFSSCYSELDAVCDCGIP